MNNSNKSDDRNPIPLKKRTIFVDKTEWEQAKRKKEKEAANKIMVSQQEEQFRRSMKKAKKGENRLRRKITRGRKFIQKKRK